jgi:D-hydroxyproline dehydrogenase subunit gamma
MFKPAEVPDSVPARSVEIVVDGRTVQAREGQPLAIALLEAGVRPFRRTPVSGAPREPVCLMGVCFECLVDVDEQRNVQSCMVEVREGMRVGLPQGARNVGDQQ